MTSPKPFRRSDALSSGLSDSEIRRGLRTGALERVAPGIYLDGPTAEGLDAIERHRIRARTTGAGLPDGSAISHVSAAVLHGLALWRPDLSRVHVSRDGKSGGRRGTGRHLHVVQLGADDVVEVDGVPCTSIARTVADLACTAPIDEVVIAGDSALAGKPALRVALAEALESRGRRQGIARARRVIAFLDGRSESPGESLSRLRMDQIGLPAPALQEVVHTPEGEFVARTDFYWKEHRIVGEFDGMGKYGGDGPDVFRREKLREDALRDLGFHVVRWTWAELSRFDVVRARFERAVERARRDQ
ncbi:type IV toxin-antitoxin system AbiEi family antitoxin domain-containing protein [Rhodococcus artemisiae]|uniref:Type IV toxin-antitoxin system AbiEi family antitoxin domain-containing protein n=1 Tax=Rhodococcus artemisiae TaxID=714159 RepID=A0ABU7LFQ7_9NOCA|nr:type IV toxin-antitoxin system AbiEi family antitoxin domain-containing protein [Rhodococcus artemisiae]MEE2060375.1 type IV toxin-antitoxin system AbiEi family antitoxin domain-containing protein [Rhodococcus artemisiae]